MGNGNKLRIASPRQFHDIWGPLNYCGVPVDAKPEPDEREVRAMYFERKSMPGTNQFEDMCADAGVEFVADVPEFDFQYHYANDVDLEIDRPICLIKHPSYKNGGDKRFADLISNEKVFEGIIKRFRDRFFFIQVGAENEDFRVFPDIDYNLIGKTSVTQLCRLVELSEMVITRPGHLLPMAEGLKKKCFMIFASKLKRSKDQFLRTITPQKLMVRPDLTKSVYDTDADIYDKFTEHINL